MTFEPRRIPLLPALLATLAIVAACSSGGGASVAPSVAAPSESAAASEAPSESAAASESAPAAAAVELAVADNALGKIITDGDGKTLYMFTPDEAGTPTCYDECAAAWPPLTADDAASVAAGTGLDASKISVVDRTDGTKQVKFGEYPLYYFANDAAPGDTNGQGVGEGKWWVVGTDGEPIKS
jgi:predicted lipoprotein with Yx(FWY)xxD motif